jgi:hypothetical protein
MVGNLDQFPRADAPVLVLFLSPRTCQRLSIEASVTSDQLPGTPRARGTGDKLTSSVRCDTLLVASVIKHLGGPTRSLMAHVGQKILGVITAVYIVRFVTFSTMVNSRQARENSQQCLSGFSTIDPLVLPPKITVGYRISAS